MKLSVIVPTHNRVAILQRTLDGLRSQTLEREAFEVIVVDDGSTDDTAVRAQAHTDVALLQGPQRGAGAAQGAQPAGAAAPGHAHGRRQLGSAHRALCRACPTLFHVRLDSIERHPQSC